MTAPTPQDYALKPCPFCAGAEIFIEPDERGSGGQWVGPVHVGCKACGCQLCADDESKAVALWNRRAPQSGWISVDERLPEWVHRDDTPCFINGKEVPPTLTSKTVLVALDGGGVRTDKLTTIEGKSDGWWHTYGERVIAWQPTPPPPSTKGEPT